MYVFGVTGSFGTGKTTVSRMFGRLGAVVIDADKMAHEILIRDRRVHKKIISVFGEDILNKASRQIERAKLAKIVFNDRGCLDKLCRIIHPAVIQKINKEIAVKKKDNCRVIVIDAPLLIEANLVSIVDKLIVVKAKKSLQIKRVKAKTKLSTSDILKRINSQISLAKKIKLADYVIDNNADIRNTHRQVKKIWTKEIINKYGG